MTYAARLNRKINGAARVRFYSLELQAADRLAMIAAKARAHIANNPAPRAVFTLGAWAVTIADENFYDWCANFGYDTDSRKALNIYEACCSVRADLYKLFTPVERETLAAILEDY